VIRGDDHISNTPKQIRILESLGAPVPTYAHVSMIYGQDGKKLSKRHGAVSVAEFREAGFVPPALVNYLALLGWSYDDHTELMTPAELVERFTLERVGASPAVLDYAKLTNFNGHYLRGMSPDDYADTLVHFVTERGLDWDGDRVRRAAPLVQEKIATLGEFPAFAGFLFGDVQPDPSELDGSAPFLHAAAEALGAAEPWSSVRIEEALRALAEANGLKPRQAFQPIRIAVTGSRISPGLFESLELLGRAESLRRLSAAAGEPEAA
jgi:glutamyl/glutaminyl-tRNA synthetase